MKQSQKSSVAFYENNAPDYDEERFSSALGSIIDDIQKQIVLVLMGNIRGKKILDIGCGTGRFSLLLQKQNSDVFSIDPSGSMLKMFKGKLNYSDNYPELIHGLGYSLPFKNNSFDGCICINVMDHIDDHELLIKEIERVLKKEGFFVFNFSNSLGLYFPIGAYINLFNKSLQNNVYTIWFSMFKVKNMISETSFSINSIKGQLIFPKSCKFSFIIKIMMKMDGYFRDTYLKFVSGSIFIKLRKT